MNLFIIEKYIQKITKNDIYNYAYKEGINLTNNEVNYLYNYLKNNYKEFLYNKASRPILLKDLTSKLPDYLSIKIEELYNTYENKI